MSVKPRQINLCEQDIRPHEPEFNDEWTEVEFEWELWMDVGKYFGIDEEEMDEKYGECNWWINFYTTYNREKDSIRACYYIDADPDYIGPIDWKFEADEEIYIRQLLKEWCLRDSRRNLQDWFDAEYERYHTK